MSMFFQKIFAFFMSVFMVFPYIGSFMPFNIDKEFDIGQGVFCADEITLNGEKAEINLSGDFEIIDGKLILKDNVTLTFADGKCDFFNYYALKYASNSYLKGTIKYVQSSEEKSEDFFLKADETEFYSFTDDYLSKKKANDIISVTFISLDRDVAELELSGISTFNRKVEKENVYAENGRLKIGVNLSWGGALSYLEDLDSDVETVKKKGKVYVDSNASKRYKTVSRDNKVNLINAYDTGRLVQQSYYGTSPNEFYTGGEFMDTVWPYNPVQGGNKYNDASKIVDLRHTDEYIYIKCRPLDWAKEKEFMTPSYMEATYRLVDDRLDVKCTFTDFSNYSSTVKEQEMPAFYCIEPLDNFYYCDNGEIKCKDDLIFWPDAGHPHFPSSENWVAFTGKFDDSFGIGLYVPDGTSFIAGIYGHGETENVDCSKDAATSYVTLVRNIELKSFTPIEYEYSITTGTVDEIRTKFNALSNS